MNSVVAFGETLLRLKSPGAERLLQTSNLEATFGGAEMNVLAALSGWGTPTRFVTLLPEGPLGDAARREIAAHGIGGEHVMRTPGRLGIYFLEGGSGARAARITYDRSNSAFTQVESGSVPWKIVLRGAGWLHLTGITVALGEAPMRAAHVAAKLARECGITVSLDVNYRAQLWAGASVRPEIGRASCRERV